MNGFRQQLSSDIANLRDLVKDALNDELLDPDDLIDAMNQVITHSNVVNCTFNTEDPSHTELAIEIEHLELDPDKQVVLGALNAHD